MKREAAETLISRLNARTGSYAMRVQGVTGGLSGVDVAAAMAGAPRIEESIARLKYAGQEEYRVEVWQWLIAVAIRISDNWRKCSFEQKELLAAFVLNEVVPNRLCPVCHGRTWTPDAKGMEETCACCDGKGWAFPTKKHKVKLLGVAAESWSRTWADRANQLMDEFDQRDRRVIERVMKL